MSCSIADGVYFRRQGLEIFYESLFVDEIAKRLKKHTTKDWIKPALDRAL